MSYAQVIVRFANVYDPSTHTGRTTSIYLGSSRYAFLTGYEVWDQAAQGASAFSIHTSACCELLSDCIFEVLVTPNAARCILCRWL